MLSLAYHLVSLMYSRIFSFFHTASSLLPARLHRAVGFLLLVTAFASFFPSTVLAAYTDYNGALISVSSAQRLEPGTSSLITVTLKNTGIATWKASGPNYTSLYHWDPERKFETVSPFTAPTWVTNKQPFKLMQDVKPGSSLDLNFQVKAPTIPGAYHEHFILTAENAAWIKQTAFTLDIIVGSAQGTVASALPVAPVSVPISTPSSGMASSAEWSGEVVDRGGSEWQLEVGDRVKVQVAFKNTGSKAWQREGANYVSLYAVDPTQDKERQSGFADVRWLSPSHAASLVESKVLPGQIGHFQFDIRAPKGVGSYRESFMLAAENTAWLSGTRITLPIRVPARGEFVATGPIDAAAELEPSSPTTPATTIPGARPAGTYGTLLLLRSAKSLALSGNGRQQLTFGFKNTGTSAWSSRGITFSSLSPTRAGKGYSVRDDSWTNAVSVTNVVGQIKPGEIGFLTFTIKAPSYKGSYTANFQLVADSGLVENGSFEIPITVTQDGYVEPDVVQVRPVTPTTVPSAGPTYDAIPLTGDISTLPEEPMIRVGLFKTTDDQMIVRAKYVPITVSRNGTSVCRLNIGESATVHFDRTQKVYILSGAGCADQSSDYYVLRTEDGVSPLEITDFSSQSSGTSNNTFRTQLELRYTPATENVWVINTLPLEWYLKGIAETSNVSPPEFQRTLLVAARTYAVYHVQRATKHANEFYTVDATYDQVYRGHGAEVRNPTVVAAIDATRGQIVTYNSKLAITPYYSRSDGRTRSWGEVWYGGSQYPWLVGVPVPWDQGKTLWGHGVGMSASGALAMANEGRTYDNILKYYYTGIELRRAYK